MDNIYSSVGNNDEGLFDDVYFGDDDYNFDDKQVKSFFVDKIEKFDTTHIDKKVFDIVKARKKRVVKSKRPEFNMCNNYVI